MSSLILPQKQELFSLKQKVQSIITMIELWINRHHQRQQLAKLGPNQLIDLGLNVSQVEQEISKPFWK